VEVHSGKVEIGQGILTALAQIVADELDVDLSRVRMVPAVPRTVPRRASLPAAFPSSIPDGVAPGLLRGPRDLSRGAHARSASMHRLLRVRDGQIHAGDRSTSYAALADDSLLDRDATGSEPKAPDRMNASARRRCGSTFPTR
jgi:CO/xanthine dehydrogenase Mo-binding subunit